MAVAPGLLIEVTGNRSHDPRSERARCLGIEICSEREKAQQVCLVTVNDLQILLSNSKLRHPPESG